MNTTSTCTTATLIPLSARTNLQIVAWSTTADDERVHVAFDTVQVPPRPWLMIKHCNMNARVQDDCGCCATQCVCFCLKVVYVHGSGSNETTTVRPSYNGRIHSRSDLISNFCYVSLLPAVKAKSDELVAAAAMLVSVLDRVRTRRCLCSPEPGTQRQ